MSDRRTLKGFISYAERDTKLVTSFVELMKKHAEFHRTAGSVAKQINGGHYAEAERLIGSGSQFALASNEVATILMRAKRGL